MLIQWNYETLRCKQGTLRIMVGRPRKRGRRERNGRLVRTYVDPKAQAAGQPHRMLVPPTWRDKEEAESNFGRLLCFGRITRSQYEAGKLYILLADQYRRVYGYPPLHPRSADLFAVRGQPVDVPADVARRIKAEHNEAYEAIGSRNSQHAIKRHCLIDDPVHSEFRFAALLRGLDNLVIHYGIDAAQKTVSHL